MSGTVVYEVTGQDFANVAKVMRSSAPELAKLMRREIRTVAKPVLDKQRQQIAAVGMTASGYDRYLINLSRFRRYTLRRYPWSRYL